MGRCFIPLSSITHRSTLAFPGARPTARPAVFVTSAGQGIRQAHTRPSLAYTLLSGSPFLTCRFPCVATQPYPLWPTRHTIAAQLLGSPAISPGHVVASATRRINHATTHRWALASLDKAPLARPSTRYGFAKYKNLNYSKFLLIS